MVRKVLVSSVMGALGWMLLVPAAFAAGQGERVGENIGDLLVGWAKSLYVGIAAVVALMFLMNRRFGDLAIFMVAALLVGGFVMAPDDISSMVQDIWAVITGA